MAAGQAKRMGKDKLALTWNSSTVLGHVLEAILDAIERTDEPSWGFFTLAPLIEVVVVARQEIATYATEPVIRKFRAIGGTWHHVPQPQPLAETIRLGLSNLPPDTDVIGFLPGDQVGVDAEILAKCLRKVVQTNLDFLVPISERLAGSPAFFHRRYVSALLELQGEQGGRAVLNRYPERWTTYAVPPSFFQDVDTPEQYQQLRGNL